MREWQRAIEKWQRERGSERGRGRLGEKGTVRGA